MTAQLFLFSDFLALFWTGGGIPGATTVVPNTFSSALSVSMLAVTCMEEVLSSLEANRIS